MHNYSLFLKQKIQGHLKSGVTTALLRRQIEDERL